MPVAQARHAAGAAVSRSGDRDHASAKAAGRADAALSPGLSIIRPARDDLLTAAVVLVPVTTVALSAPATTMTTLGACARVQRGAAAEALASSRLVP